jgi:hypothetical protein
MPTITEYKRTRSSGVLGLRSTGKVIDLNARKISHFEFAGISIDTETEIYQAVFIDGSSVFVDYVDFDRYFKVSRVNNPELGRIWYADLSKPAIWINQDERTTADFSGSEVAYCGFNGIVDQTGEVRRFRMLGGTSFVVYAGPLPLV